MGVGFDGEEGFVGLWKLDELIGLDTSGGLPANMVSNTFLKF